MKAAVSNLTVHLPDPSMSQGPTEGKRQRRVRVP